MPASSDSSSSPSLPLTQHVDDLYTLARVLVGPERAETLVTSAYEAALRVPPDERPADHRAWLLRHLLDAHQAYRQSQKGASAVADDFRQQAAESLAARALPVAFASCSTQERLLLTLDVQSHRSGATLRNVLDRIGRDDRDFRAEAWSALRAALRDTLTGPERMLVDVALTEEALESALHTMLADHMRPAPSGLRRGVSAMVRDDEQAAAHDEPDAPEDPSAASRGAAWWMRRAAAAVLLIGVLALGGYGMVVALTPEPAPDLDVVTFSARRVESVRPDLATQDPVAAEKYVQTQWARRLTAPVIEGATMSGVGTLQAGPVGVPVLLYADSLTGGRISVVAYTYAQLDRIDERAPFSTTLRGQLAEEGALIPRDVSDTSVVLWRRRDDVFVAVSPRVPLAVLARRIRP